MSRERGSGGAPSLAEVFRSAGLPSPDPADPATVRAARALWGCLVEPGDGVAGAVVRAHGPVAAYDRVLVAGDLTAGGAPDGPGARELRDGVARWTPRLRPDLLADALAGARACGARLMTPEDAIWPARVDDLGDHAPVCLWLRGDPAALQAPDAAVALVGARAATGYGEHMAGELAAGVAEAGAVVVSGAAYGIDGAAHRAALASAGRTVAFLAGGCDRLYPAGHASLLERIMTQGAVVAEAPCGATPTRWRFLARNRLIAAASDATVVVEAGVRSGALNTAHHAAALGRALGAVPGPVTSAASAGAHALLRESEAVCVTGVPEVLELVGRADAPPPAPGAWTDERARVRDALSRRVPRAPTDIAARSGLAVAEVQALLGEMLLDGVVEADPAGWRLARR